MDKNMIYANADGTAINMLLDNATLGSIPFTASVDDVDQYGRDIYAAALAGEYGDIAPYQAPGIDIVKSAAVGVVRGEAGRIILARYPQHTQANLTARAVELIAAGAKAGAEYSAILDAWAWIKAVRAESNRMETAILAAENPTAVAAVVPAWPA